jgi:hypothetical protein
VDLRDQLLAPLTDRPATVQMRALLELGETQLFGTVEGAAFAHAEAALGVLIGRPTEKTLRELTRCGLPPELVAHEPVELAGYAWEAISLSTGGTVEHGLGQLRSRRAESGRLSPAQWRRPREGHGLGFTDCGQTLWLATKRV